MSSDAIRVYRRPRWARRLAIGMGTYLEAIPVTLTLISLASGTIRADFLLPLLFGGPVITAGALFFIVGLPSARVESSDKGIAARSPFGRWRQWAWPEIRSARLVEIGWTYVELTMTDGSSVRLDQLTTWSLLPNPNAELAKDIQEHIRG